MTDRQLSAGADVSRWLPAVALLLIGAALTAVTPLFPVMTTADGSDPSAAIGTAWLAVVPAALVLVAALVRSDLGTAAAAGAGAIVIGRLLTDLGLLLDPDAALRPELFGVRNVSAFPLSPGWGAAVPLIADAVMLVGSGLAARTVLDGYEPPAFDDTGGPGRPRAFRASPFTFVGLVGVALLISSNLGVLYASPIPVVRPLGVADIGLFAAAGAAFGGLVLCLLVVVAAALPRIWARGVMLGAGVTAAIAPLTALLAGGDTNPSGLAWVGLIGAVLLAATGVLLRTSTDPADPSGRSATADPAAVADPAGPGPAAPNWTAVVVGVFALAGAACAVLAFREPQATAVLGNQGASFDAAGAGYLPGAVVLGVCGLLALIPPTAAWGRLTLTVAWVPLAAAVLTALEFTSSSIWVSSAVFTSAAGVQRSTGSWWGVAAVGLAVLTAVLAAVVSARFRDAAAAALDPVDDTDAVIRIRAGVGWALTVLIVVAYAFPVYSANGRSSSALFVGGARVDTYAAWLSVIVLVTAGWVGCRSRRRSSMVVLLLTAAVVAGSRVALTPAVRHQLDFSAGPGQWFTVALVVALVASVVLLRSTMGDGVAPVPEPTEKPRVTVSAGTRPTARTSPRKPGVAVRDKRR